MNKMKLFAVAAVASLLTASSAFAEVQLSIQNGRVSLVAKDATVRQILTEWARIGQTKILNVERIPGGPLTLELTDVPEQQALDILLRSISGYMAAPRAMAAANLSVYDRIVVMPTTAPPRTAAAAAPPPTFAQPQFQQPQFQPPPTPADDDADDEQPGPNAPGRNSRGPVFNTFPQPQVVNPQTNPNVPPGAATPQQPPPAAPAGFPTAPAGGVSVPGMVAPPPLQPGQVPGQPVGQPVIPGVGQPVVPGQPVRRPGGGPEGH
jgi:hypothetical protein